MLPPSLITAAAAAAAAGKNPWLPFGILFLAGAFPSVPSFIMEPTLHRGLYELAPAEVLVSLAVLFLVLAALDSFADKVSVIESWLTPLSTLWRPFAAVAVSVLIAHAVAHGENPALLPAPVLSQEPGISAPHAFFGGGGLELYSATVFVGLLFGVLATLGKVGTRLLLSFVPVPNLKLAHSILDDVFAFVVTCIGIWWSNGPLAWLAVVAGCIYLTVGALFAPLFARLTVLQLRVGLGLLRKGARSLGAAPSPKSPPPRWLSRALSARESLASSSWFPAYAYRAPGIGWCRAGLLVWTPEGVTFAARKLIGSRRISVPFERLERVGLAEAVNARQLVVVERLENGARRQLVFSLFPGLEADVLGALQSAMRTTGLVAVDPRSESARAHLPDLAHAYRERFVPAEKAGSLRTQGLVTVLAAALVGGLTLGTYIPIGAGYLFSPMRSRFLVGLALSAYLSLCALTGFGLPLAIFYGALANALVLRDLTRHALAARLDGRVDRWAFLPPVCGRVWVRTADVLRPEDRTQPDYVPVREGSWSSVTRALARLSAA
jgi:hypothetical protein